MKFKIYFDLDDVGNELSQFIFNTYNKEYNDNFNWLQSEDFIYTNNKELKADNNYFERVLCRKGTYFDLCITPGYAEVIQKLLNDGYDVRILTQPVWKSPYCLNEKVNWIKKHLPFFDLDNLIMTKLKDEIAGEGKILLDDNPRNLERWEQRGGVGVSFLKIKYSNKWNGHKVSTFDMFYELVKKLEN